MYPKRLQDPQGKLNYKTRMLNSTVYVMETNRYWYDPTNTCTLVAVENNGAYHDSPSK
jgi:hypothetical protein